MAEANWFITEADLRELLEKALGGGYRISLNKNFKQPSQVLLEDAESCGESIKRGEHAFLLERDDFTRYPIGLREITKEGIRYWYPRAKEGGPAIEVYYFSPFEKAGRKVIPCSLISYHEKILNPANNREEPAGAAVKKAFSALLGELTRAKKVKAVHSSANLSPRVLDMLSSGWELAAPYAIQASDARRNKASAS